MKTASLLEEKITKFAGEEPKTLKCLADFSFEDGLLRLPLETSEGYPIEATFCNSYGRKKHLLAASVQVGCPIKCSFCDLGEIGFKRNLTDEEIIDELRFLIRKADQRGYNPSEKPLKASFVMGGEPLLNPYFPKVFDFMSKNLPIQTKVSTIFPNSEKSWQIYEQIVEKAAAYPNITQFQISLNSTNRDYRQSVTKTPLAQFEKIRQAGELWAAKVPNPRKIDLTFTLNENTPINPLEIKDTFSPELFAIRLRDYAPTSIGYRNNIKGIDKLEVAKLESQFQNHGYLCVPGLTGHIERHFNLAPGTTIQLYNKMKNTA